MQREADIKESRRADLLSQKKELPPGNVNGLKNKTNKTTSFLQHPEKQTQALLLSGRVPGDN